MRLYKNTDNTEERPQHYNPTQLEWAYAAALVDADGCITISSSFLDDRKGNPYRTFDCKTEITNTSMELMDWLHKHFGGKSYLTVSHISKKAKANGQKSIKPCYRWYADGREKQKWFVINILPYLVIKKEQANLALEYLSIQRNGRKGNKEKRLELHLKMKVLNKVGESVTTNTPSTSECDKDVKIESDLMDDHESGPRVISVAEMQ